MIILDGYPGKVIPDRMGNKSMRTSRWDIYCVHYTDESGWGCAQTVGCAVRLRELDRGALLRYALRRAAASCFYTLNIVRREPSNRYVTIIPLRQIVWMPTRVLEVSWPVY
jgi:hypothetical protein